MISFILKYPPYISEIGEKVPQSAYLTTRCFAVSFIFDLLTSKSNGLIFVPNCTEIVNLDKF